MLIVALMVIKVGPAATPTATAQSTKEAPSCLDYDPDLVSFRITSTIPHDVYDAGSQVCLKDEPKPPTDEVEGIKLQWANDIFSWQSFLAINWPVDPNCSGENCVKDEFADDSGVPQWVTWKERYEVFKPDGSEPSDWGTPRMTVPSTTPPLTATIPDKTTRVLHIVKQANSELPLWDQNGNLVYYEILMNDQLFEDIRDQELYHLQGQIDVYNQRNTGTGDLRLFTWGSVSRPVVGAIALKLAWKIMDESKDISDRYYTRPAHVLVNKKGDNWDCNSESADSCEWQEKTVGLVGIHIAHKTFSSSQWVWSTFEHVDNVQVNDLEVVAYVEKGKTLKPSFYNPSCETCPVNVEPEPDPQDGLRKTQVMRVIPIPEATEQLNDQVHALLEQQGSVWQYYDLIGTQSATDALAGPAPADSGLDRITNQSGGKPEPVYLVNSVIETYDQKGNQPAGNFIEGFSNYAKQTVFGTQSCMGCHYSAELAVAKADQHAFRLPGIADFSFMVEKAQWMKLLFSITSTPDIKEQLNNQENDLPEALKTQFEDKSTPISPNDIITVKPDASIANKWYITVDRAAGNQQKFIVREEIVNEKEDVLNVYIQKM